MSSASAEGQQQPYSIKLEGTAKGVRLSVHVYGPENMSDEARTKAIDEAIKTYKETLEKGAKQEIQFEAMKP